MNYRREFYRSEKYSELTSIENFHKYIKKRENISESSVSNTWLVYKYFDVMIKVLPKEQDITENDLEKIVLFSELNAGNLFYETVHMINGHLPKILIMWRLKCQIKKHLSINWLKPYSNDFAREIYYDALHRNYKLVP